MELKFYLWSSKSHVHVFAQVELTEVTFPRHCFRQRKQITPWPSSVSRYQEGMDGAVWTLTR